MRFTLPSIIGSPGGLLILQSHHHPIQQQQQQREAIPRRSNTISEPPGPPTMEADPSPRSSRSTAAATTSPEPVSPSVSHGLLLQTPATTLATSRSVSMDGRPSDLTSFSSSRSKSQRQPPHTETDLHIFSRFIDGTLDPATCIARISPWRLAVSGLRSLILPLAHMPTADLNRQHLRQRRLVAMMCEICCQYAFSNSPHSGLGNPMRGHGHPPSPAVDFPRDLTPRDKQVLRLVIAATKVPARVVPDLTKPLPPADIQNLAQLLGLWAFTGTLLDVLGETPTALGPTYHNNGISSGSGVGKRPGQPYHASVTDAVSLVKHVRRARVIDSRISAGLALPTSHDGVASWLCARFGFTPRYISHLHSLESKRAVCRAIATFLLNEPSPLEAGDHDGLILLGQQHVIDGDVKLRLAIVYAAACDNGLLAAQFATIAMRRGVSPATITNDLTISTSTHRRRPSSPSTTSEHSSVRTIVCDTPDATTCTPLLQLAFAAARRDMDRTRTTRDRVAALHASAPAARVEIACAIATCAMLHRLSAVLDDAEGWEPAVRATIDNFLPREIVDGWQATASSTQFDSEVSVDVSLVDRLELDECRPTHASRVGPSVAVVDV